MWHGNPQKYNPMDINPVSNKLFGELYLKTFQKELLIIELGYNLVSIWESEYDKIIKDKKHTDK